jgi:glycosyltransferase involved in cell wall biosynthesis
MAKVILHQAKKVIIVDAKNQQQFSLLKKISPNHLVEISNAIDTNVFHHIDVNPEKLGYKNFNEKKILLFVGNLLAVKRLDLILLALKKINNSNFVLLIVGDGYEKAKYQNLSVELGLSDQVVFLGKILDKNLLAQYYSVADLVVIPSDYESFSLVALESLACATPLIVSKIDGMLGRVNEGVDGLFFLPGNDVDLSQKIIQFFNYSEEQRRQMGQNGCEKVTANYNWTQHTQDLLKVYFNK